MDIKIIDAFRNANDYLLAIEHDDTNMEKLWQKYMIEPYWEELAKWAPFDQSFKKPLYIKELSALKEQLSVFSTISIDSFKNEFLNIAKSLPMEDDTTLVGLYPLCDSNKIVKERQNGVLGVSIFGNIILNINPLANDFQKWIPYVFAHEYHHNKWGYNWFVLHNGQGCEGTFLESMVTEGQADLFAESLLPDLNPQWNKTFNKEIENNLWEKIKPILFSNDPHIHTKYMFGNESENLPWCMGYSFGKIIVMDYLQKYPNITFLELINIPAKKIYESSRFSLKI